MFLNLLKRENGFSMKKFFVSNSVYAFFNISFLIIILVPFLRSKNFTPLELSSILSAQELSMFICMYIGGILFDKLGARNVFLIGRMCDITALLLLLSNNLYVVIFGVIVRGAGYGIMFGKYTAYIYNVLSIKGKLNFYARFSAGYYFIWDIGISVAGFLASILLKTHSYDFLIWISVVYKVLALLAVFYFIPSNKNPEYNFENYKSSSIKEIFSIIIECVKKDKRFAYLLLFYGLLNFITWDLAVKIGDLIFLDIGWNAPQMAKYTTILSFIMGASTIIPMIFFPNGISVDKCVKITFIQLVLLLCFSVIYNDKLLLFIFAILCMTFSLFEVSIEKSFEEVSNKKVRGSVISIAISIGKMMTIISTMLVGVMAKYLSYRAGMIVISTVVLLISLFLMVKLMKESRIIEKITDKIYYAIV